MGLGFRVSSFGFRVRGDGCVRNGVWSLGFWGQGFGVWGLGFRFSGFGFQVSGFRFWVPGFGFRISGLGGGGEGLGVGQYRSTRGGAQTPSSTTSTGMSPIRVGEFNQEKNDFESLLVHSFWMQVH